MLLDVHRRARQAPEVHAAHPAVAGVLHEDAVPAVVLEFRMYGTLEPLDGQVLDAALCHLALIESFANECSAVNGTDGCCQRGVERQRVSLDRGHGAVPRDVDVARFPACIVEPAAEIAHRERCDPRLGGGPDNLYAVADMQSGVGRQRQSCTPGGHFFACNADGITRRHPALTLQIDGSAAVGPQLPQNGFPLSHATNDDARGLDAQRLAESERALAQKNGAATTLAVGFHRRNIVDATLQQVGAVALTGFYEEHVGHVGYRLFRGSVAAGAVVHGDKQLLFRFRSSMAEHQNEQACCKKKVSWVHSSTLF